MAELYDIIETTLMWGGVVFVIGFVIYLGYLQRRRIKHRRARRRRHERRARRRQSRAPAQGQLGHELPAGPMQPSTKS